MSKIIISGVLAAIIGLTPLGIKTLTDKTIEEKSLELKENGISINIVSSKGYINSTRDFILTIEDEVKFKEFLKARFLAKYPSYKNLIDGFAQKDSSEFDDFLKGIVFKGDISNSNINFSSDIEVNTYLHKFSDKIMEEIKKEKEDSQIILPFLEKKALNFNMIYDKTAKLKSLRLKDIKEDFEVVNKAGIKTNNKIEILGYEVINSSNEEKLMADISLSKFLIDVKSKENTNLVLNNVDYSFEYKNQLENSGIMSFDSFIFNAKPLSFNLGDTILEAKGEAFNNLYKSNASLNINSLKIQNPKSNTNISDIVIKINANELDYASLKQINKSYMKFQAMNIPNNVGKKQKANFLDSTTKSFVSSLNALVNKGFNIKFDVDLNDLTNEQLNLKSLVIDVDATLTENNIDVKRLNNVALLNAISSKININMFKSDMENLTKVMNPRIAMMISMFAKEENGKVIFDIDVNKGKVVINGKNLN